MNFRELDIAGAYLIDPRRRADERGFFARVFCERQFAERGLCTRFVQCSVSFNRRRGTLRGLHYQAAPHEETKLVRCTRGAIWDVIADLRPGSPTRGKWAAAELSADNGQMLYVPAGLAHGFQTLRDDAEVLYMISAFYDPAAARGVRWDDPTLAIDWPGADERVISARDLALPLWEGGP